MDWTLAIDRNRDALLRMLAALLLMAGGGAVMPRHQRAEAWLVLRPAESALRRLIVVVKHVLQIEARVVPPRPAPVMAGRTGLGTGQRAPSFALFDRRKRFEKRREKRGDPRIRFFDDVEIFTPKTVISPDDMVSAERLNRRLEALQGALADLPKAARRMARWEAKRALVRAQTGKYIRPMRPGVPPGHRARRVRPVDFILSDCHALALYVLHPPDT